MLLVFVFVVRRGRGSRYLASLGISIPASAITAYQKGPFNLTGDEYMIAFQLPPSQIPALTKQMQSKERYEVGPYPSVVSSRIIHASYVAKFFAAVPKSSAGGNFLVIHNKDEKSQWATLCSFAIDKPTGRVWFYGDEIYN